MQAIITRSGKDFYQCQVDKNIVEAVALPSLLETIQPVVGDKVILKEHPDYQYKIIDQVLERKNEIYRLIIRENKKKIIASNIDQLVVVMSVSKPKYKRGLLDRYLLRSLQWEIPAVVIFNKADELNIDIEFERKRMDFLNIPHFLISAHEPQNYELQDFKKFISSQTSIFLGQSGVGKSKLISALSDGQFELLSGELAKVGKGAHTTTWAELIQFDEFSIVDSPGVRTMNLDDIFKENLQFYFQDLVPWFEQCRFPDCKHLENSKGCGFKDLDPSIEHDKVVLSRLDSYLRFFDQLAETPTWARKKSMRDD